MPLTRTSTPIVIDGRMDDAGWVGVEPLPLTMHLPVFRGTPVQRSEIRVVYDNDYIYFGGWFWDSSPKEIRANSLYRDRFSGDDTLAIYIDAFNDNQNSKWFGITPAGMRFDILVSDDGNTSNGNWDGFWDARTQVTDEGWFVETRIPFSTLGFIADPSGDTVMGLTVTRLVSRTGERVTFPAIDPAQTFRRPSLAQDVVVSGVETRRPVYVTPYVLSGRQRFGVADATTPREVGIDVKMPVSGQLTLDLTVNTDFAQVEADDQQVALDRFPLFFPERRRFFQENSGVFDFQTSHGTRLFHSRRIGLAADQTPVPILGGVRLAGRAAGWDVGALSVVTDTHGETSREHFGVVRLRRQVINPFSTAGLMVTSVAGDNPHNLGLGADTSIRVQGDHYLSLKWASTFDSSIRRGASVSDKSHWFSKWERRTGRGLGYSLQYARVGSDFTPELGFLPRRDVSSFDVIGNYFIFTDGHRFLRRVYPGALAFSTIRNSDGALESGQYAFWVQWDTKAGGGGWIEPKWFRENVATPFRIGGKVDIPAGRYRFVDLQVALSMAQGARLRTNIDFRAGSYFDGRRTQVILTPTWNVSKHLELGGSYQLTALRFPVRNQQVDIHLAGLRIGAALDVRWSGTALLQYNSTTRQLDSNLRLRFNMREGSDLWVVFNEGTDLRDRHDLVLPGAQRSQARTFLVKLTRTLQ
ncbi:MAG: DUF5916 domain-containing protein [Vicinamibacterales bacterium]